MQDPMTSSRGIRPGTFAAVLAIAAVLASLLAVLGIRWAANFGGEATEGPGPAVAVRATRTAEAAPRTSRLLVSPPRRLIEPRRGGTVPPGGEIAVPLPASSATAVLVQVTLTGAVRPGGVALRSSVEEVTVLRLPAAGGQSSATTTAVLGADRRLAVRAESGGQVQLDLVGTFEPAARSGAGRVIAVPPTTVSTIVPSRTGNDVVVDSRRVPAVSSIGSIEAVLLRVEGQVGNNGGYVAVGPEGRPLDQKLLWGKTSDGDRMRNGVLLVRTTDGRFRLQYHAGTRLTAQVVGAVTGEGSAETATGLVVPVPAGSTPAVRVTRSGRADVPLVPGDGLAGVPAERVGAAVSMIAVNGRAVGAVQLLDPGAAPSPVPDLTAAAARVRTALTLNRVVDGRVSVLSARDADVVVTPRLLVLR